MRCVRVVYDTKLLFTSRQPSIGPTFKVCYAEERGEGDQQDGEALLKQSKGGLRKLLIPTHVHLPSTVTSPAP